MWQWLAWVREAGAVKRVSFSSTNFSSVSSVNSPIVSPTWCLSGLQLYGGHGGYPVKSLAGFSVGDGLHEEPSDHVVL